MTELLNISIVTLVLTCSLSGLLIYLTHGFLLNRYLLIENNLIISILLPAIALVITKAISSNFFLSLGMIGALSIIRYRTPVKSAYELSLLFSLITVGVVGNVNVKYAIGLAIFISLVGILFHLFKKVFPNKANKIDEKKVNGYEMVITILENDQNKKLLDKYSAYITSIEDFKSADKEKKTIYSLSLENINLAKNIRNEIVNEEKVENISISPKFF
ncbi:DUF4956 domain-containing protein [Candidatus Pelagibacter sp.]|uniref:DUF4956 domain-containing protein n=1 Tax=Candidatus Pelagibacter sp. TaxID=2024849 RepID=UPI003F86E376